MTDEYDKPTDELPVGETPTQDDWEDNSADDAVPGEVEIDVKTGAIGTLTDGTGISQMLKNKVIKDLVLDALLSIPVSLAAINIAGLESALIAPMAVGIAVADSLIRVVYRAGLRWAQS